MLLLLLLCGRGTAVGVLVCRVCRELVGMTRAMVWRQYPHYRGYEEGPNTHYIGAPRIVRLSHY